MTKKKIYGEKEKSAEAGVIPHEAIEGKILLIRGKKVMQDADLAELYGVPTKSLNLAVKRNMKRFPEDFMFRLNKEEHESLRFQIETLKGSTKEGGNSLRFQSGILKRGKHSKYLPYAFTEHGILMLSSVLNSDRAVQVNIALMRVFVELKEILSTHKELTHKLGELERKIENHDGEICTIFEAIRQIMDPPQAKPKRKIGFHHE